MRTVVKTREKMTIWEKKAVNFLDVDYLCDMHNGLAVKSAKEKQKKKMRKERNKETENK
jgi:hypothetical protein